MLKTTLLQAWDQILIEATERPHHRPKRFNILTYIFRNRKAGFADQVIAVAAGLWNFWLA